MKKNRDKVFSIRLSEGEFDYIKDQAESQGNTMSGYIRWIIRQDKEGKPDGKIYEWAASAPGTVADGGTELFFPYEPIRTFDEWYG